MPRYKRVELKQQKKIDNDSNLKQKVKKIWSVSQVVAVKVAIGSLGVTLKIFKVWLKKLDVRSTIELLKKVTLLRTLKTARQGLES